MAGFFMLQQFRWLRVVTYINLFLLSVYLVLAIFGSVVSYQRGLTDILALGINFLIAIILITHTTLLISIQYRNYPDKEIGRHQRLWLKIMAILSWICISILFLAAVNLTYNMFTVETDLFNNSSAYWMLPLVAGLLLLSVLMVFQLAGGRRLRKTIERNSRQFLEDSFL